MSVPAARSPVGLQFFLGLALLVVISGSATALDFAARNPAWQRWFAQREEEFCRRTGSEFMDAGYFIDPEDRLLNEELPAADYSQGGVYLFGSSNTRVATKFWELPAPERRLIHNYAISKGAHQHQEQWLHYLIDDAHLLKAGGDKTLVVFALSYHDSHFDGDGFFALVWGRHGLYHYDAQRGIS